MIYLLTRKYFFNEGTQVNFSIEEFENRVNDYYRNGSLLVDGYAPFWYYLVYSDPLNMAII